MTGKYRWTICALLFFATTVNYLDRAVISLVKEYLDTEFNWTKTDYANVTVAFQLSYALANVLAGRLIDRLGTKTGYALSLLTWSVAAMGHFFARTHVGLIFARVGLGITEAGNFPAAIKAVSEWFPKKERAFATGVLNAGTNAGAIIAPLIVPFIALAYGWRGAFLIVGATGLIWLFFWYRYYDTPARQKRLSRQELDYIQSDTDREPEEADATPVSWRKLLSLRQTWAFGTGKFMTDGIWWFYLFWLPDFLKEQYGLSKTGLSAPVAVVYLIAIAGSLLGGWLPLRLANLGWPVSRARRTSMLIYACCATPVVAAQALGEYNMWFSVLMIGLATAAHQAWSANIFTTVSDMFPRRTVGFVTGFGGLTGTLGAVIIAKSAGYLFDYYKGLGHIQTGYFIMFVISGSAYLCAWFVMRLLVPEIKKADL